MVAPHRNYVALDDGDDWTARLEQIRRERRRLAALSAEIRECNRRARKNAIAIALMLAGAALWAIVSLGN